MATRRIAMTDFTGGYVAKDLHGRIDYQLYKNGASEVKNARIKPQGGAKRRAGTKRCQTLTTRTYQHEKYVFNSEQAYNFLFYAGNVLITDYDGVTLTTVGGAPWTADMIGELSMEYAGDTIFICHEDMKMQVLTRTGASSFTLADFAFEAMGTGADAPTRQPYYRYAAATISMRLTWNSYSGGGAYSSAIGLAYGSTVTLTTTSAYFTANHVGVVLKFGDGYVKITAFTNSTTATATIVSPDIWIRLPANPMKCINGSNGLKVYEPFHGVQVTEVITIAMADSFRNIPNTGINGPQTITVVDNDYWEFNCGTVADRTAWGGGSSGRYANATVLTREWYEPLFSAVRGYARSVGFHQGRLIFGGARDAPQRVVMSQTEAPYNFDVGTGLDNESIQFDLRSKKTPKINHVLTSTWLAIFTSEAEFYMPFGIGKKPLTPSDFAWLEQSTYGTSKSVKPCLSDGSAAFVTKSGVAVREMVYRSDDEGFTTPNLSFQAQDLLSSPVQLDSLMEGEDTQEATLYVANGDGTMAVLSFVRAEQISAWGEWDTDGDFKSVCVVDKRVFVIAERTINGVVTTFLEYFDSDYQLDGATKATAGSPTVTWAGLTQYAGQQVHVVESGRGYHGTFTVSAAGVLTLDQAASDIEVGFYYEFAVKSLPPETMLEDGPSLGQPRHVCEAAIKVNQTMSAAIAGQHVQLRPLSEDVEDVPALEDGYLRKSLLGWNTDGRVRISAPDPVPIEILALALTVEF